MPAVGPTLPPRCIEAKDRLPPGAGSGIGLATAKAFADAGASVVLADRDQEGMRAAARQLSIGGRKALAICCDVTDKAQVTAMIEQAVDSYGRLDAAFNNAGINCENAPLLERSDDEFDRIIAAAVLWLCSPGASYVIGHTLLVDGGYTAR